MGVKEWECGGRILVSFCKFFFSADSELNEKTSADISHRDHTDQKKAVACKRISWPLGRILIGISVSDNKESAVCFRFRLTE